MAGSNDIWKLLYPDKEYRAGITKKIEKIISDDSFFENIETKIRTKSGTEKVILWNTRSFPATSEQETSSIAIGIDITERKKEEEELRTDSGRLLSVVDSSRDFIAMIDSEYRYIFFNTAFHDEFKKIFGPDLKIGDLMPRALANFPEDIANAIKYWDRALMGEEFTVTQQFGDPERERNWYDLSYSPIRNSEGKVIGAMHIARNATGLKQADENLVAMQKRTQDQ